MPRDWVPTDDVVQQIAASAGSSISRDAVRKRLGRAGRREPHDPRSRLHQPQSGGQRDESGGRGDCSRRRSALAPVAGLSRREVRDGSRGRRTDRGDRRRTGGRGVRRCPSPRCGSGRVRWPTSTRSWRAATPATRSSCRRHRSAATSRTTPRAPPACTASTSTRRRSTPAATPVDVDALRRTGRPRATADDHDRRRA